MDRHCLGGAGSRSEDRQGARSHRSALAARPRRRSDRVTTRFAAVHESLRNLEVGDVRRRPKHGSSCSTVEEDLAAAVIDGSALPAVDSHPNCIAIGKAHPRSGLSRSDFVLWHRAESWPERQALVCSWGLTGRKDAVPTRLFLLPPMIGGRPRQHGPCSRLGCGS